MLNFLYILVIYWSFFFLIKKFYPSKRIVLLINVLKNMHSSHINSHILNNTYAILLKMWDQKIKKEYILIMLQNISISNKYCSFVHYSSKNPENLFLAYLTTLLLTLIGVWSFSFLKQPCKKTHHGHIPNWRMVGREHEE